MRADTGVRSCRALWREHPPWVFIPREAGALESYRQKGRRCCPHAPSGGCSGENKPKWVQGGEPGDQNRELHRRIWEMMGLGQVAAEEWGEVSRSRTEF